MICRSAPVSRSHANLIRVLVDSRMGLRVLGYKFTEVVVETSVLSLKMYVKIHISVHKP